MDKQLAERIIELKVAGERFMARVNALGLDVPAEAGMIALALAEVMYEIRMLEVRGALAAGSGQRAVGSRQ